MSLADKDHAWLDHLSQRAAPRKPQPITWLASGARWLARFLLVMTTLLLLVGIDAMMLNKTPGETAGGNAMRQLAFLLLAALSLPLILLYWQTALRIVIRSWALLMVFAILGSTALWAAFPFVTIRRLIVFLIIYTVGLGIACVLRQPRDYLVTLMATCAGILFLEYAVTVAMPGYAMSDLGLAALHSTKNLAGMVGQIMAVIFGATLVAMRGMLKTSAMVLLIVLTFAFLVMTQSKTAIGLTVLALFAVLPAMVLAQKSRAMGVLVVVGLFAVAGLIALITGAFSLSWPEWAKITTGDASLTERDDIWYASATLIREAPVFGYGFGSVWSMLPLYHPLQSFVGFWTDSPNLLLEINQSHNGYIDLLIHGGIYLLGAVGLFIIKVCVDIGVAMNRGGGRWSLAGNALTGTFMFAFLTSNLLESSIFFPDAPLGQMFIVLLLAFYAWLPAANTVSEQLSGERGATVRNAGQR